MGIDIFGGFGLLALALALLFGFIEWVDHAENEVMTRRRHVRMAQNTSPIRGRCCSRAAMMFVVRMVFGIAMRKGESVDQVEMTQVCCALFLLYSDIYTASRKVEVGEKEGRKLEKGRPPLEHKWRKKSENVGVKLPAKGLLYCLINDLREQDDPCTPNALSRRLYSSYFPLGIVILSLAVLSINYFTLN